jgi:hypothetical protein
MTESTSAQRIIRELRDEFQIATFAARLKAWLAEDQAQAGEQETAFSESRARALLRATNLIDDATLQDFADLVSEEIGSRVALYDLLNQSGLSEVPGPATLSQLPADDNSISIDWLSLATASFAWKSGYYLEMLDPASPPGPHSPAGQVLTRTAHFVRSQVQRSPTERDRLGQRLAQPPSGVPTLDEMNHTDAQIAPVPPHFRTPIPENFPEIASETLTVNPNQPVDNPPITVGQPLTITESELTESEDSRPESERLPAISITNDQIANESRTPPSPMPSTAVVLPNSTVQPRPSFTMALRQMFGQEELTTTKLRVIVQEFPDGPGYYGLQIRVRCKGIKSYVAGTSDRDGRFVCELPVRLHSGLTYDVEVTWPRDVDGEVERKSITLNADRTEFTLPFHRQLLTSTES